MNGVLALGAPHYNLPPLRSLNHSLLEASLTYDSYQDKFHTLLYYEEHEHEKVLRERLGKIFILRCALHCFATCVFVSIFLHTYFTQVTCVY